MELVYYIIIGLYVFALIYITFYCLMQFHLLFHYQKHHKKLLIKDKKKPELNGQSPFVTVQLPIYNERFVVERLIDRIVQFDYPKNRFEIHILDDSTDETVNIVASKVAEYQHKGFNIQQIRRLDRKGYKAGALKDGMKYAKGKFIAIFDADFLPERDFLKNTIPYFNEKEIGVVQTRWEHINQDYSIITEIQAFQLNVHFTVEQLGRLAGRYMLQFNGTAGVWRRKTIEDAGGWEADTLTEDLDLSYRAQLKGWKIIYLEEVVSPAELPSEMNGLKSQQFRWMKGGAETAKKMLPTIWSSNLSLTQKLHASTHLLSSTVFLCVFIVGVFSVPILFLINPLNINTNYFMIFLSGLTAIGLVYYVANVQTAWKNESKARMIFKFILLFPIFLSLSMGLSLHNSIAVIQGYIGKKSAFVRTPKFNIQNITDRIIDNQYLRYKLSWITIFEGMFALYFFIALVFGISNGDLTFIIFHFLLMMGFGTIFYFSIKHLGLNQP